MIEALTAILLTLAKPQARKDKGKPSHRRLRTDPLVTGSILRLRVNSRSRAGHATLGANQ
jgi:hypothetical protein